MPSSRLFPLKSKHEDILKAVHFYRYVTVSDITLLFFSPSSSNYVGKMLATLAGSKDYADRQYLFRFPLPHTTAGNTEKIYTLGSRGRAFLQEQGMEVDWYFRPSDVSSLSYYQCLHALTLTRALVAAEVYCRDRDDLRLAQVRIEYELKRLAPTLSIDGRPVRVVPDAWLNFELHGSGNHADFLPVLLEIDRGSEYQKNFKGRIAARLEFIKRNGGYKQLFGTNAVTIAYLTTGNQTRLATIMQWTHEVLEEQGKEAYADLFRFCSMDREEITPERLFRDPSWVGLHDTTPLRLLE